MATHNAPTKESREQFDRHAANYANSPVHRSGPSLPVLVEYAKPTADDFALDIATGTGNAAFAIADAGANVVGIDIATKMLERASERAVEEGRTNVRFQEGDAESIPFPDNTFTLVVVRHAPHHFRDADKFLSEVARVLKPSGRFVMVDQISPTEESFDWNDYWQRTRDNSHFRQRTIEEWQEMAKRAGLNWIGHTLVPYRMEFVWWVGNAGASPEAISKLRDHARNASPEDRNSASLEFDSEGEVVAFADQMMVVRMEPKNA
jgi:ubiquinone/menaquinone biosynthesis C-methylase UbiE